MNPGATTSPDASIDLRGFAALQFADLDNPATANADIGHAPRIARAIDQFPAANQNIEVLGQRRSYANSSANTKRLHNPLFYSRCSRT